MNAEIKQSDLDKFIKAHGIDLVDRADCVKGHFCIRRMVGHKKSRSLTAEYWNDNVNKWCSAGTVYDGECQALVAAMSLIWQGKDKETGTSGLTVGDADWLRSNAAIEDESVPTAGDAEDGDTDADLYWDAGKFHPRLKDDFQRAYTCTVYSVGRSVKEALLALAERTGWGAISNIEFQDTDIPCNWYVRFNSETTSMKASGEYVTGGVIVTWWK